MDEAATIHDYDHIWKTVYGSQQEMGPTHRHLKRIVSKLLATIEYESVLDVGCGPGDNLPLLCANRRITRITGADISRHALERARRSHAGEFEELDIQRGRLDGRWDLVYCSLVLEHLPDDVAALENLRAMTGRYLLLTTIAGDFERYRKWDETVGHVRNYRVGELEDKLAGVDFTVNKAIYWGFPFYSPIARTLQNFTKTGAGQFSTTALLIAKFLYYVYFLNSHRRGDVLTVLAQV